MAVGTYDANGIWHYGESDNIAPFSTTLNKLADSASSAITADRARLATLEAGSLAGLIPIKPGTITAVSGTASVNSLGTVTFTNCTKISLGGVFSAKYSHYKIIIMQSMAAAQDLYLRYINNSGEIATTDYSFSYLVTSGASISAAAPGGTNYFRAAIGHNTTNLTTIIDVLGPYISPLTWTKCSWAGGGNYGIQTHTGYAAAGSGKTGISFYTAGGTTFSGTVTVYGYNN